MFVLKKILICIIVNLHVTYNIFIFNYHRCFPDTPYNDNGFLHIILGVVASLILLIFIIFCVLHHRRKVHQRKHRKEIEVRYVTRAAGGTNPQPGSKLLLREETEKVSVVW